MGIREIARLANVSPGTVDRALHGRKGITDETRARILTIAESIGYSPDLAVGVWVGNADYTAMQNTTGLTGAAPLKRRLARVRKATHSSSDRSSTLAQIAEAP